MSWIDPSLRKTLPTYIKLGRPHLVPWQGRVSSYWWVRRCRGPTGIWPLLNLSANIFRTSVNSLSPPPLLSKNDQNKSCDWTWKGLCGSQCDSQWKQGQALIFVGHIIKAIELLERIFIIDAIPSALKRLGQSSTGIECDTPWELETSDNLHNLNISSFPWSTLPRPMLSLLDRK